MVALLRRRNYQRWHFAESMLAVHLLTHLGQPEEARECHRDEVHKHLNWQENHAKRVVRRALQDGYVHLDKDILRLTAIGKKLAGKAVVE